MNVGIGVVAGRRLDLQLHPWAKKGIFRFELRPAQEYPPLSPKGKQFVRKGRVWVRGDQWRGGRGESEQRKGAW